MLPIYTIYALVDKENQKPFYVGKTKEPLWKRMKGHWSSRYEGYPVNERVQEIGINRLGFIRLDFCTREQSCLQETYWIQQFIAWGFNLTNMRQTSCVRSRFTRKLSMINASAKIQKRIIDSMNWGDVQLIANRIGMENETLRVAIKKGRYRIEVYEKIMEHVEFVEMTNDRNIKTLRRLRA